MKMLLRIVLLWTAILAIVIINGCGKADPPQHITLSNLQPLENPSKSDQDSLRVALAVGLSPSQSIARFQVLTKYLSETLNRSVELVQRKSYKEVDGLIQEGKVDIAFVCSSSYVIGQKKFGERLVAVPITNGSPYYQSVIIADTDSGIRNWTQLKGHSFAFVDPQSTSGSLYALSKVKDKGGLKFFKSYIYTYGHSNSITAVKDRLVEAAAVDNYTLAAAFAKSPQLVESIRIINTSPDYANNPVVASPRLDEQSFLAIQKAFLTMHLDENGQEALQVAGYDQFKLLEDSMYDSVRALVKLIGE